MKRRQELWMHMAAGVMVVLMAAAWNMNYHRAQAAKEAAAQRRSESSMHAWRDAKPEERAAAADSIRKQLDAFRKGDYETAILYQSEGLKTYFTSAGMFRKMIETRYPQFAHYRTVEFGRARADEGGERVAIRVRLTGRDGVKVRALYMMVREGKVYRVSSVMGGDASSPYRRRHPGAGPDRPGERVRESPRGLVES